MQDASNTNQLASGYNGIKTEASVAWDAVLKGIRPTSTRRPELTADERDFFGMVLSRNVHAVSNFLKVEYLTPLHSELNKSEDWY